MKTERATPQSRRNDIVIRGKGRPTAAQAAHIHDHILDTAWTLFMRRGFEGVTVSDIAKGGSLSKRTIYNRFKTKDAIFVAVLEAKIADWTRDLARPICDVDFRGWLRNFAERMLRLMMSDQIAAIERLTISESNRFPHIAMVLTQGYSEARKILTDGMTSELARQGRQLRPTSIAARCWFDMLAGHVRSTYRISPHVFDIEAHLQEWLDPLVDIFLLMLAYEATEGQIPNS